jgi:hypothetical protein
MTQPLASPETTAEVRAHERVVRYRRSGTTGPALVLVAADHGTELWPDFSRLLAERYRVISPDLPDPADAAKSLRSLLEGLGCIAVPLIAAGRYCDAALELVLERHESVGRVLLVPELSDDEGLGAEVAALGSTAITAPLHVISRRLPVGEAIERVFSLVT